MKVTISVSDPWELGEFLDWHSLTAEVQSVVDDADGGLALIKLAEPLAYRGASWRYLIGSAREVGVALSDVRRGRKVFSALVGISSEQANSADPFKGARMIVNSLSFIGTVAPTDDTVKPPNRAGRASG